MGNSAPLIAEFTRSHHVDHGSLHRQGDHLCATDLLLRLAPGTPPVLKKVPRALFMDDIKKRPDHDQECHYNDECPHEDGRHGRRKVCEWIAGKHSRILRLDGF